VDTQVPPGQVGGGGGSGRKKKKAFDPVNWEKIPRKLYQNENLDPKNQEEGEHAIFPGKGRKVTPKKGKEKGEKREKVTHRPRHRKRGAGSACGGRGCPKRPDQFVQAIMKNKKKERICDLPSWVGGGEGGGRGPADLLKRKKQTRDPKGKGGGHCKAALVGVGAVMSKKKGESAGPGCC